MKKNATPNSIDLTNKEQKRGNTLKLFQSIQ